MLSEESEYHTCSLTDHQQKDPRNADVVLEVGDKIDASTTTEEQKQHGRRWLEWFRV